MEVRWVVLDELHVLERRTCSVGQRHAVAADVGVGRVRKTLPEPPLQSTTDFAVMTSMRPVISSIATTCRTRPSSTRSRVTNHSS